MGMSVNLNKIVDSKVVGMSVFALTGVGKLVSDYKNAPDDKKDFVFGVKFEDGNRIDFRSSELEKLSLENQIKYRNLKIDY